MNHENFILIVEATIIIVETTVLIFLLYHIRELHKRTVITHEEIKTIKKVISEMHNFVRELNEGTTCAHQQIEMMKKILSELHRFSKGKQSK